MKTTPAEALPGGRKQPGLDSFGSRCSSAVAMSLNVSLIILDPLYSTHDQDENDIRAMAALALQRPPRPSVVRRVVCTTSRLYADVKITFTSG